MGRELLVVWAGRHQRKGWDDLCGDYRRRIERFAPLRDVAVKSREVASSPGRPEAEARALLAALPEPCWTVALDRKGKTFTSEELADWLERRRQDWPHPIAFLIGSDLGLPPRVLAGAREQISLGPLTLPHELARLVLYEQLYRALSLSAGINYHRGEF
ncbi:MAG TPA: 23S rRNA (pseudouridine(1915)-N(3))-methyltransferase RlmH [Thermoanaerobaculia bacterium]|nr:23S rRNA (pseudouridine(1915)-N(3))-methyltransferase RlmH [Thermoanaerobaculia bacterium]